jgi:hypothetical protein
VTPQHHSSHHKYYSRMTKISKKQAFPKRANAFSSLP